MFLFGDETAMPIIMRIIENVPINTEVWAIISLRDPEDVQKFTMGEKLFIEAFDMRDKEKLLNALKESIGLMCGSHLFFAAEKTQAAKARELIRSIPYLSALLKLLPIGQKIYSQLYNPNKI